MKILHILNDSNIGGAGKLLYNITRCIDRKKFEFIFVFTKGSQLVKLFKPLGLKIYTVNCISNRSFDIKSIVKINKIINKEIPDIVHTHSSLSGKIAAKISGINNMKSIYTKHCVFDVPKIMRFYPMRMIYRLLDNLLSDSVIAVADAAKYELIEYGVKPKKIHVIVNGSHKLNLLSDNEKASIKRELNIENGEFIVGISARLEKYKGHKYLLDAAHKATVNNDNVKFIIMGDGTFREQLEEYAYKLGISRNVIFLGFIEDVAKYVNIFDINVNCSIGTETSSLSISEGLSLGKPAIVSNFGGNPNMVINGATGYVINQKDSDQLYKTIIKLKNNPRLYNKMRQNALVDFNKRFSDIAMTQKYEKFYEELVSNNADRN